MVQHYQRILIVLSLLATISLGAGAAAGQSGSISPVSVAALDNTGFTFQGALQNNGTPVTGTCDFTFTLYPALIGGTRLGEMLTAPALPVSQGFFQTTLDYGYLPLNGEARWIETAVRCPAGTGAFATLEPRQRVLSAPYAVTAMTGRDGFTVHGDIWVNGHGIFGAPGDSTALSLRSPDVYLNADSSFGRGDGGRALVHGAPDVLEINHAGDFAGGVKIAGPVTISGSMTINSWDMILAGNDFKMYGAANRGDGGRALVHDFGDTLVVNYGHDFSGGTLLDSDVRVAKDLQVQGNTIRLLGNDFYLQGDADRGDGGRALTHTVSDVLSINYEGDFAGGVRITDLRTGGIVEENLMPPDIENAPLPFHQGEVLCWDGNVQSLAYCGETASPLVIAVADQSGRPLVFGAEPINVIGPVQPGDLLVSSATPGFAVAWQRSEHGEPLAGVVIGKALQSLGAGSGQMNAFIMLR